MKYHRAMSDRKLFANSFLSARNAMVSSRIGNLSRTVSCLNETQWNYAALSFRAERSGVEKSPIGKFPVGKKHSAVTLLCHFEWNREILFPQ